MPPAVDKLCNDLARHGMLPADEVRELRQRWLSQAGAQAGDEAALGKWLVGQQLLTPYQLGVLQRGNAAQLRFDRYLILDRIGKGRMAGVFKARHDLGTVVAIKVLPPSRAKDPPTLARFQREARLAARLSHPNVVRTYQTGETNGLHYLVMEHLEGETLEELLQRRGKLPPAEAVRIVYQALKGLGHVHERGMVHRDLKPANLMLVPSPGGGGETVKLLDIGTGRALFDDGPGADLTTAGDVLGTPEYMSPEQARDPRKADIRSDIYSLGCVLYHALAGQPPFVESNPVRLLVRHASEPPRPLAEVAPGVPDGLQKILDWMLAKDPAGRYPTPDRAASALEVFLAAGATPPAAQAADPTMQEYQKWLRASWSGDPDDLPEVTAAPDELEVVEEAPVEVAPRKQPPRQAAPLGRSRPSSPRPAAPRRGRRDRDDVDVELVPMRAVDDDEEDSSGGNSSFALLLGVGIGAGVVLLLTIAVLVLVFVLR